MWFFGFFSLVDLQAHTRAIPLVSFTRFFTHTEAIDSRNKCLPINACRVMLLSKFQDDILLVFQEQCTFSVFGVCPSTTLPDFVTWTRLKVCWDTCSKRTPWPRRLSTLCTCLNNVRQCLWERWSFRRQVGHTLSKNGWSSWSQEKVWRRFCNRWQALDRLDGRFRREPDKSTKSSSRYKNQPKVTA